MSAQLGESCPEFDCKGKMIYVDYSYNHDKSNQLLQCSECGYPWQTDPWQ